MAKWGAGIKWGKGTKWGSQAHEELADGYGDQLRKLLPRGVIWTDERARSLSKLLRGWGDELARIHERMLSLIEEADPRTTDELIDEWEALLGLPDPCDPNPPTALQDRRDLVVARLIETGGSTPQYFIDIAAALGITITITEQPFGQTFRCGTSRCGEALSSPGNMSVWQVNAPAATVQALRDRLECTFDRIKPAHTFVQYSYTL